MTTLNVILGAGFSFDAGLPLVGRLSEMIRSDYKDRIIRWTSGEWKWAEGKHENEIFSGRIGGDHVAYSYMMNEVIQSYTKYYGQITNYEVFFDLIENAKEHWFQELQNLASETYRKETEQLSESVVTRLTTINKWNILELLNYLIADSLVLNKPLEEVSLDYLPFLKFIEQYDKVNIHTLNHDLLVESLLNIKNMPFSDGFLKNGSELKSEETDELIPTYQSKFDEKISILKLHGSIDLIQYRVGDEQGSMVTTTGKLIYFKPENFRDKHGQIRIDPSSGNILQTLPCEVVPKFITGLTKPRKIAIDYMYSDLFKRFKSNVTKDDSELLVIGYSFGDAHINEIIQSASSSIRIVNVNPTWKFPFKKYKSAKDFDYMKDSGVFHR